MKVSSSKRVNQILIIIFVLAFFLRIFKLGTFPIGFHVDEAKVGWESYSILKTTKDDHGNFLNLYYNSFGDYRPTGIFYITIPSLLLFGKNEFAVRFPAALLGAFTIFPVYFLTFKITKKKSVALIASFILAIIPWHIATSRATSEVVITCFLVLSSLALLDKKTRLSFFLLVLSFFFYHSARVVGPLLMLTWIIYSWKKLVNHKKIITGFILTSLIALILLLSPAGRARYGQVKLETPSIRSIIIQYSSYFDPNFFIGDIAKPFRYTSSNVGIVSIPIFTLFLLGIALILKTNKNKILLILLALGPIPASLTLEDSPNLHRSFFMLPFLVIIAAIGLSYFLTNHKNLFKIIFITITFSFISFVISYTNTSNNLAYAFRNPQSKDLSLYLNDVAKNYNRIYVTNDPDSPYPWYAFFTGVTPQELNPNLEKQVSGKWMYKNIVWDNTRCPAGSAFQEAKQDENLTKILVIDNGMCTKDFAKDHPEAHTIKEFSYLNVVNYRIWEYIPTRI